MTKVIRYSRKLPEKETSLVKVCTSYIFDLSTLIQCGYILYHSNQSHSQIYIPAAVCGMELGLKHHIEAPCDCDFFPL